MSAPGTSSSPCQRAYRTPMEQASRRRDSDAGSPALLPPLGHWPGRAGPASRPHPAPRPGALPVGWELPAALPSSPATATRGGNARLHTDSPVADRLHLHRGPGADHGGVECDNGRPHVGRPRIAMSVQRMPDGAFARPGSIRRCRQCGEPELRPGGIESNKYRSAHWDLRDRGGSCTRPCVVVANRTTDVHVTRAVA